MKKLFCFCLIFAIVNVAVPVSLATIQEPAQTSASTLARITNQDVKDMAKAGLATEVIVAKIKSSPSNFDTSPTALSDLKSVGIPDPVILAMVQATNPTDNQVTQPDAPAELAVKVPDGTEIEIVLKNTLSGQEAKVGDIVDFMVLRAIQIKGVTIFEKDASARARVTTAKKAGHWGKAGKLEWAMQDVQAVDGTRTPARFTKRELGDSKGGTVAVGAVATTILLGPAGLLWGLKKGKPAIIPAGNRYSVFVHGDALVKGKTVAKSAATP